MRCLPDQSSVIYRTGLAAHDYDEAIEALQDAKKQPEHLSDGCTVCCDGGHTAGQCHHNPLVMARRAVAAAKVYRCYHCYEVFTDPEKAGEHFGKRASSRPQCQDRPKVICICGSTRFIEFMAVMAWELEKEGAITLGCHLLPNSYTKIEHHLAEAQGVREHMDTLHRKKIDMADEIFVVNVDGYIGESTRGEIEYATNKGKPVRY